MNFLVVNYHYFGNYKLPYQGIHSIQAGDFKKQIEALGQIFEFVTQQDIIKAVKNNSKLPDKCCLLTFDDGIRSQFTDALPILEEMKVPGLFFFCGKPYIENKVLTIHKIHWLRSQCASSVFLENLKVELEKLGYPSIDDYDLDRQVEDKYFWDDIETRKVKFILNVLLPEDVRDKCISKLFEKIEQDEAGFCRFFYMDKGQIQYLHRRHQAVGVHSYAHRALAKLGLKEIRREISLGMSSIESIISFVPISISYPYGYREAVSHAVAEISKSLGIKIGFTMERSFNSSIKSPLLFARLDTNDAPMGKRPLLEIKNGSFKTKSPMTKVRKRYFEEQL